MIPKMKLLRQIPVLYKHIIIHRSAFSEPLKIPFRCYRTLNGQKLKLSYASSPGESPLLGVTIGQLLQQRTEQHPEKEAFILSSDKIRKTFAELLDESDQLAAGLLSLGLKKGDRIGIWGPNSLEWILTQYATARTGMILVNINPQYRPNELEYVLNKVGCKAIVVAEDFKGQSYYEMLFQMIPELARAKSTELNSHILSALKIIIMMGQKKYRGTLKFSDVMEAGTKKERAAILDMQYKLQFDNPINIQFTSGTTGFSKGVTLTHHNIVNNSYFMGRRFGYHEMETVICVPVPLFHCFGMVVGSLMMVTHGSCCVFPSGAFDAGLSLKAVSDERCTSLYGVPTMFIDMMNHPQFSKFDLTSLHTGLMAGAPCPIETMKQVISKMHLSNIMVSYGSTETSPTTFQIHMDDDIEKRVSTVGRPLPHVEAKVIGENGDIVPIGTPGEICTRGYTTMLKYWGDAEKMDQVIKEDRWYHTGDIGEMDEDGYVKISGRINDMIIRGGENVYPLEIEQVLYKHPKIKDVQIVGVPDKRLGEEICAWVILKEGQTCDIEEIRDFCKQELAKFKVPKYVQFVEDFPMTVTGKVQKYKIRDKATRDLGLDHIRPN